MIRRARKIAEHAHPTKNRLLAWAFTPLSVLIAIVLAAGFATPLLELAQAQGEAPTPTAKPQPQRKFDSTHIKLPDGYRVEPVVINLSVPTTAVFDGSDLLVAESGWANTAPPRVLRIKPDWTTQVVAEAGLEGPVTGLRVHEGQVYVSHRGKVSVVEADGKLRDIVTGLPSEGDHQNNNIVLGPDGKIYMSQGTVTNSAVVGIDNYLFGWLPEKPQLHETPCKDITLVGENFETDNPLTEADDKVTTGAYKPFGTPSTPGETIKGSVKCGGSIVRFNPDGSGFELVAWGLRNPYGLEFDDEGQLWSTFHGADVRGSRPVYNDPDYLVRVEQDAWYGWPEFFAGEPVTAEQFNAPGEPKPQFLWQDHPPLTQPYAMFETHEATNGLAFSPGGDFGFEGHAFIAMFGTYAPVTTGINMQPVGFRVVRFDTNTKEIHDFASNVLPGPSYINQQLGFDRPSDVVFGPDSSLYVVDWGASTITDEGLKLTPLTGAVWRIYPESGKSARPDGALIVEAPAQIPEEQRKTEVKNAPEAYLQIWPQLALVGGGFLLVILLGVFIWRVRKRTA
ncbi:MAG TPA: PQQ-dependent sugar dehydrogenase [Chloroflexia bacterium]|jgi:glucose/arabinose dehydrogenase